MKSGVYQILNLVNGKRYIGSSSNISRRFNAHKNSNEIGKHSNAHLVNAFKKHGLINFEFSIIEECVSDILFEKEQFWIDYYGIDSLYNKRKFANTNVGVKWSEERKEKWRGRKVSPETSAKMSKNCTGNRHPRTDKQKQAMRESRLGKPTWNKDTKGIMKSNKTSFKKGLTPWNKGNPNAFRGPSKSFELVSPEMILYSGLGVCFFEKEFGITNGALATVSNGKREHHKGWRLPKEGDIYEGYGFWIN